MSEERKDVNVKLTDEAVEAVTGGDAEFELEMSEVIRDYRCPNCRFVYSFIIPQGADPTPPNCPRCGYPGLTRSNYPGGW